MVKSQFFKTDTLYIYKYYIKRENNGTKYKHRLKDNRKKQ